MPIDDVGVTAITYGGGTTPADFRHLDEVLREHAARRAPRRGWECPRCHVAYAPSVPRCWCAVT